MFYNEQSECFIQASKKDMGVLHHLFNYKHMFVHSATTHSAMLGLKKKEENLYPVFVLDFHKKMSNNSRGAQLILLVLPVGFEPTTVHMRSRPLAHLSLSRVHNNSCVCFVFMLHCHTNTATVHNDP